ncbi:E3 ubiquitin-protein ligase PRT1-like [Silene latifolia]|uniref:E3 ubiquitin-protein ligase PRT1-like n=1 Tax=Silene latifolia TaxID=37657 RepID=UPI003D7752D4
MSSSKSNDVHMLQFEDHDEETISDSFICCVCLDLLYKPIVLECGHVSCFWCVHNSMDPCQESHCPICRNPYHYFPTICERLHFLLVKMYPLAYKRREKQILEEEEKMGLFSPQLGEQEINNVGKFKPSHGVNNLSDMPRSPCIIKEDKDGLQLNIECSTAIKENSLPANVYGRNCKSVSIADLLCPACNQLFFRPTVLNCGHVLCEACIVVPEDEVIICKVCEIPHPRDCPNICVDLNNFVEEQFPDEFAARKGNIQEMQSQFQHKNPSFFSTSKKSAKNGFELPTSEENLLPWSKEYVSKLHGGVGCDHCGMYPIVGERYKCQDCKERIGFDLCGECYNTRSKRPGRFNQQHTPDHKFELMKPRQIPVSLMFQLVGRHIVDGSGTPAMAISAMEDSSDGWIEVDSTNNELDDILDGSLSVEFSDALSPTHHDADMEHQEDDPPST